VAQSAAHSRKLEAGRLPKGVQTLKGGEAKKWKPSTGRNPAKWPEPWPGKAWIAEEHA